MTTADDRTITFPSRVHKIQAEAALAVRQAEGAKYFALTDALGLNRPGDRGRVAEFIDLTGGLFVCRVADGLHGDDYAYTVVLDDKPLREFFPSLDVALLAAVAFRNGISTSTLVYAAARVLDIPITKEN